MTKKWLGEIGKGWGNMPHHILGQEKRPISSVDKGLYTVYALGKLLFYPDENIKAFPMHFYPDENCIYL